MRDKVKKWEELHQCVCDQNARLRAETEQKDKRIGELMECLGGMVAKLSTAKAEAEELKEKVPKPGEYVCRDAECPACKGSGKTDMNFRGPNYMPILIDCYKCNGTGVVPERVVQA